MCVWGKTGESAIRALSLNPPAPILQIFTPPGPPPWVPLPAPSERLDAFVQEHGMLGWLATSARTGADRGPQDPLAR